MTSLSKQYVKALARLKTLEAAQKVIIERLPFANPRRFCASCAKDVGVATTSTVGGTELSAICEGCGADLTKEAKS